MFLQKVLTDSVNSVLKRVVTDGTPTGMKRLSLFIYVTRCFFQYEYLWLIIKIKKFKHRY